MGGTPAAPADRVGWHPGGAPRRGMASLEPPLLVPPARQFRVAGGATRVRVSPVADRPGRKTGAGSTRANGPRRRRSRSSSRLTDRGIQLAGVSRPQFTANRLRPIDASPGLKAIPAFAPEGSSVRCGVAVLRGRGATHPGLPRSARWRPSVMRIASDHLRIFFQAGVSTSNGAKISAPSTARASRTES